MPDTTPQQQKTAVELAVEALVTAKSTKQQLDSHEAECTNRYRDVLMRLDRVSDKMDDWRDEADKRFRTQVYGIVGIIVTVIGTQLAPALLKLLHMGP